MGALREGIRPFPEVALWFVSGDTEMNEKSYKRVFGMFAQHKTLFSSLFVQNKKSDENSSDFFYFYNLIF
jgi:hypothetical protein